MSKHQNLHRRDFLKTSAAGAGLLILPSGIVRGQNSPNNKLNIAVIGVDGRAKAHYGTIEKENVVALCDIDDRFLATAAKKWPNAKTYNDWRKCLEQKDIDAVVCSTPDHTHAHIATWSMNREYHIYCEKPLANTVEEARVARATYLEKKSKISTQIGTQRHANNNFEEVRKLIREGAIGELQEACAWGDRQIPKPSYLPAAGDPPEHLHYDLWVGPSPLHPYNPGYFDYTQKGSNCLNWNMYWDFGSGQIGDMGSHTMDLAYNAIDAELPTAAVATGDKFNPDVTPVRLESHFKIPSNSWRPEIKLSWFQGGAMPEAPTDTALKGVGHGAMFTGTKGWLVADFGSYVIIPKGTPRDERLTRNGVKGAFDFQGEWVAACKGGPVPSCNFDYAGKLIETMLLGLVAYRVGEPITYDGATGKSNNEKANALMGKKYREGWPLDG